jgi:hypothetical protein
MDEVNRTDAAVIANADVEALVRAVLAISPDDAERVRNSTPSRRRPQRQVGPTSDYGTPND